jgi:hypothetical protein
MPKLETVEPTQQRTVRAALLLSNPTAYKSANTAAIICSNKSHWTAINASNLSQRGSVNATYHPTNENPF